MRDINRRIENAEKKLNLSERPVTIKIILFGGELPPDRNEGNISYQFVMYDGMERK